MPRQGVPEQPYYFFGLTSGQLMAFAALSDTEINSPRCVVITTTTELIPFI